MADNNNIPVFLFHEGTNFEAYKFLGAHPCTENGSEGAVFRVWAPAARSVSVVGDFNEWDRTRDPMTRISEQGIYEKFVPNIVRYDRYMFSVEKKDGSVVNKADPFAFHSGSGGDKSSKFYPLDEFAWSDGKWQTAFSKKDHAKEPMNIYEAHLGSWRQYPDGNPFSYRKSAHDLVDYVKEMGYTHIELLPVTEYPLDASWGYQVTGYFAPTSRYGVPNDLKYFVNRCHEQGIAVIMDWVPAHFPKDEYALADFDGDFAFEYKDKIKREQPSWGTVVFDYGKTEVQSFLISSALYWLNEYHMDGLRVDAVSAMLYLDFGKNIGLKNSLGGDGNLEAIALIKKLNDAVHERAPGKLMIAEESTAWPKITEKTSMGGLGFDFKWNMGWMNDSLRYLETDPFFRNYNHNNVTFSMVYAYAEKYILPISHDEVVHGKKSLLDKNPGSYEEKFAGMRAFLGYMYTHVGKKLLFMGSEFGQFREWDFANSLEWFMLDYDAHAKLQNYVKELNYFYLENPALWEEDCDPSGFNWIVGDDNKQNILVYERKNKKEDLIVAINFSPVTRDNYEFGLPSSGVYSQVFCSEDADFGGGGALPGDIKAEKKPMHGMNYSGKIKIPALSVTVWKKKTQTKNKFGIQKISGRDGK